MIYLLPQTVDRASDKASEREAFCVPGQSLRYGELFSRSNQLARLLLEEGVKRGDRVGIFMPRGLESAVSVYGIMKAGAAFVPIDPHLPAAGLQRLVEDCGIRHLVTLDAQAAVLQEFVAQRHDLQTVVGLDSALDGPVRTLPWSLLEQLPGLSAPVLRMTEDDLAYIMYSSGSTGRPKGIMHTHRSGLAYARLSVDLYGVTDADRVANHSPLHFDMSTFGYFSSPLAAATTVLIPEAYTKMAASLAQLIEAQRITIWYSVPLALIQLLLRGVIESRDLTRLRWVLFGGEPFPVKHLRDLMLHWPHARFSNVYGPAEVNQCTYYHVPPPDGPMTDDSDAEPVPIGSVWDNTEGLVLDADDNIIVEDEVGELVVRSPTMMQGYWARPDLNAAAFYRQSLYENFDKIFYRTGDLVRRRSDGQLLFLGRKDRQIKVRGYRVELDDVEHTLAMHPKVDEAAVFAVRADAGVDHIEAAVVPKTEESLQSDELDRYLTSRLSPYAVPANISVLESFPRTSSGKIDRRKLQAGAESFSE